MTDSKEERKTHSNIAEIADCAPCFIHATVYMDEMFWKIVYHLGGDEVVKRIRQHLDNKELNIKNTIKEELKSTLKVLEDDKKLFDTDRMAWQANKLQTALKYLNLNDKK